MSNLLFIIKHDIDDAIALSFMVRELSVSSWKHLPSLLFMSINIHGNLVSLDCICRIIAIDVLMFGIEKHLFIFLQLSTWSMI